MYEDGAFLRNVKKVPILRGIETQNKSPFGSCYFYEALQAITYAQIQKYRSVNEV
jgi:hypothetical protein